MPSATIWVASVGRATCRMTRASGCTAWKPAATSGSRWCVTPIVAATVMTALVVRR